MEIALTDWTIKLDEKPRHKSVVAAQNILVEWLLGNVDIQNLDQSATIEDTLKHAIQADPRLATELLQLERSLDEKQTIILATGMTFKKFKQLEDTIYEDDYRKLYDACVNALGGTAADFFEKSGTDSGLNPTMAMPENSESEISENLQNSSSEMSTVPLMDMTSTSQS